MKQRTAIKMAYCRACRGVGEPKESNIGSAKPIAKCRYCHSLNIREADKGSVESAPSWYTKPVG